jgi:hypothetical protein
VHEEVDTNGGLVHNLVTNYWDGYDFTDTILIEDPAVGEQALVDFIALFATAQRDEVSEAIVAMLDKATVQPRVFDFFKEKYRHYLYDPNSPMRNDVYYEPVLTYLAHSEYVTDTDRIRYSMILELVRKNMPGATVTDFGFMDISGRYRRLHDTAAPHKLIVFYDPSCAHCGEGVQTMSGSEKLNELIGNGRLQVLGICPVGDLNGWKDYQEHIPVNWINGFDQGGKLISQGLYDLKAFPTIFLVDAGNRVILKDTDIYRALACFDASHS